ncbi:MAG: 50S ribosomal protein L24 [Chloroflexota bacterium]
MSAKIKIRKGDTVEIVTGQRDDKGKRGEVIRVVAEDNRLVVQSLNMRKKHQRQFQAEGGRTMNPGIIEFEGPLHISNVMLVCPKCDEKTRVGITRDEVGLPYRVCKKCGKQID